MLPVLNSDLAVSDVEFNSFIDRHFALKDVMCVEDNSDMTESYIMVDPYGRFFQNKPSQKGGVISIANRSYLVVLRQRFPS
jgi:radical S-adenosyl methionine domain-containing protein 2